MVLRTDLARQRVSRVVFQSAERPTSRAPRSTVKPYPETPYDPHHHSL